MKTIPGFPNYTVTKDGRVWSKKRKDTIGRSVKGKWLIPAAKNHKYLVVFLFKNGKQYCRSIHRLVLQTYIGSCPIVNYKIWKNI